MTQKPKPAGWPILLAAIALTCLICAVFFPVVGFKFIDLDVGEQLITNRHVQSLTVENLKHIFTSRCARSYYPVRTLSFAIDYQIWGLNAGGFKLTNCLIHLANVLLVFWLILRLFHQRLGVPAAACASPKRWWNVSVAAFSAGVFAVHPVVVEPVVWVPGREELLMTLGALGCIHFHITARRLGEAADKTRCALACYIAAAFCCAAACLSNAVAAVIPMLIVAWDALTLPRPTLWRILSGTAALWVIGLATIVIKLVSESMDVPAQAETQSPDRLMLVLNVYWLNLKTVFWPRELALRYERVLPGSLLDAEVILGGIAIGLTCLILVILWTLKRWRLMLFGLLWFGLALAPSSQIIPHYIQRADRYLYLPLVGLAVAMAMGLRLLEDALKGRAAAGVIAVAVLGLLLLGILSADQVQTWQSNLSVWERCAKLAPNNDLVQYAYAESLAKHGQFRKAIQHYEKGLQLAPDFAAARSSLALLLATCPQEELRDYDRAERLASRAYRQNASYLHTLTLVYTKFAESLADRGQLDRAIQYYNKAIEVDPTNRQAMLQLASILADCGDEKEKELRRRLKPHQDRTPGGEVR